MTSKWAMSTCTQNVDWAKQPDKPLWNMEQAEEIKRHLEEVAQGSAFKGSHRSQEFLRYVVEKSLECPFDHLKERTIGIELFRRLPTYDTGEDAIVRVTASDVRRRLLQHYGRYGASSHLRINLPSGSYLPTIEWQLPRTVDSPELNPSPELKPSPIPLLPGESSSQKPAGRLNLRWGFILGMALAATLLVLVGTGLRAWRSPERTVGMLPWTAIFRSGHATQLIISDPNLEELQELTGRSVSLSDYANQRYVADPDSLSSEQRTFYTFFRHADEAAAVDTPLAADIARLAPPGAEFRIRTARSIRIADLQTDDKFILFGSPRSNPWFELFQNQLDFRFNFSKELNQEIIENVHPLAGEQATYMPTARGFATGESFAVVALVQSQNQAGQALLLAGANGEGTEAAGRLVTDQAHLAAALKFCKLSPGAPIQDFELLLRLHTMAGSPSTIEMVSCHHLSGHRPS